MILELGEMGVQRGGVKSKIVEVEKSKSDRFSGFEKIPLGGFSEQSWERK